MFNMMPGVTVCRLSNKLPCLSAISYLTRGTKCIKSDLSSNLQILSSYNFKELSKCTTTKEQKNETYSFLVPCGRNKAYLINSERDVSLHGIISLALCNLRPTREQDLLSYHSSTMTFPEKDAGVIKSMMSPASMQQMLLHLSINNLSKADGELKMCGPVYGISDTQGYKRNICTTEIVHEKKIEFCPPKKSGSEEDCDSEETNAKANAKGKSKKECLTPKNEATVQFCGNGEGKKECLTPKNQSTIAFCGNGNANAKVEAKSDRTLTKSSSASKVAFCTKADTKKSESKGDSMQMKAPISACPGGQKGPEQKEQKPPKKEEGKKSVCAPPKPKVPEKKAPPKEEPKKDPCAPKPAKAVPPGCEPKPEKKPESWIDCPPKIEEKKRVGCDDPPPPPKPPKPVSTATPDKPLKGNIPYPCPRMKKKDQGGTVPIWQCALISGFFLLLAIAILIWSLVFNKPEEPELDSKGRPIKKK